MKNLNKVFRKNLLLLSIIILVSTVIIINIGFQIFFRVYLSGVREKQDKNIVSLISGVVEDGRIDNSVNRVLNQVSRTEKIILIIQDSSENTIYATHATGLSRGTVGRRQLIEYEELNFVFQKYKLELENKKELTVHIGREEAYAITKEDEQFMLIINVMLIIIFIIAVIIVSYISKYLSNRLSKPIIDISKGTALISKGEYNKVIIDKPDICELNQLAENVEMLAYRLIEQEELRKRMVADISHELNNPLAVIISHLEAMIDGVFDINLDNINKCYDESNRLKKLIDDLNELAKIESDLTKIKKEKINISELLNTLIANHIQLFNNKNIEIKANIEKNIFAFADKDKINIAFRNILMNSYKYSNNNCKVEISLMKLQDYIEVKFSDEGIGIPKEDIPYVFERFYRSDVSRSRETGGAGIGLSIVKTIMETHNWKIELYSEEENGTDIVIKISN